MMCFSNLFSQFVADGMLADTLEPRGALPKSSERRLSREEETRRNLSPQLARNFALNDKPRESAFNDGRAS